jgi:hypothetical protein
MGKVVTGKVVETGEGDIYTRRDRKSGEVSAKAEEKTGKRETREEM